jgi:2Fe-2S ferredoxin
MPKITFITCDGKHVDVHSTEENLMKAAKLECVEGIDGNCGGVCSCATCHVHVHPEWMEKVGPPGDIELSLLELEDDFDASSRLCCQIKLTPELDGLVVRVAER